MENKPYTDKTVIPGAEYTAGELEAAGDAYMERFDLGEALNAAARVRREQASVTAKLTYGFYGDHPTRAIAVWNTRAVTESMVTAGAALSTTGRADRPSYRERIRKILTVALQAKE